MPKLWKTAILFLLVAVGLVLFLRLSSTLRISPPPGSALLTAAVAQQSSEPIDLTSFYDQEPSFDEPGCWQAVPRGAQTLANVPFRISGLIQLWGEGPAGIGRNYRESVEGIPVTGKFQTLYVLHGASFTTVEGTPIAEVVFRYQDGSSTTNAILYGTQSRDWWQPVAEHSPLPPGSTLVAWRGDHPSLPDWVKSLRLFATAIPNPRPDSQVKGLDLISTKSRVTWLVLAVTAGPAGLLKADPLLVQAEDLSAEDTTIVLTALDNDTGQPIRDVQFQITLFDGRRAKPYGSFGADEHGQAMVDLPPARLKLLTIETVASDYQPSQMIWNLEKGEKIPTNHVFKISKKAP